MFALLGYIGTAVSGVYLFIKSFIVGAFTHGAIVTGQLAITVITVAFVVTFYFSAVTGLIAIYNLGIEIFNYASNPPNSALSCMYGFMNCSGVTPALQNGFALMYSALSGVVIFHLMKYTYGALKIIGNEFFKLGLLLGQALK